MQDNKEAFIELLKSTNRDGVDEVIEDLTELGFFKAPASSKFHLNEEGGLLQHSLNVCRVALELRKVMIAQDDTLLELIPKDSVIIAALLHDVCKSDIYKPVVKTKKDSFGLLKEEPGYALDYSNFPLGHGEKSVIMLLRSGLDMTDDEIMAIRWHMHAWDLPQQSADIKSNYNMAKEQCPLLSIIISADSLAASLLERKEDDL